jgi:UPF0042 nucleotide-binding protein
MDDAGGADADAATPTGHIVVVSGMSGAGRSAAADVLEDLGWFVIDNLPPGVLPSTLEYMRASGGLEDKLAVVVDVRSRSFFADLNGALAQLEADGWHVQVLFLEASDDVLVRRYESVRRPHPLQGDGRVLDGIQRERSLVRDLRGDADLVVDTSTSNIHELRAKIVAAFRGEVDTTLRATIVSFGYKYGLPVDADLVVDCRFLPNPHWVDALRPKTGLDEEVRAYVLGQDGAEEFVTSYAGLVSRMAPAFVREGKQYVTIAVGCTGGKHRSVAIAGQLASLLGDAGLGILVVHRDLGRE